MKLAAYSLHHTPWKPVPVVLLHGLFGKARNMQRIQKAIFPDFDSIALDLRNHGHSPHGEASLISMARDVQETLLAHHISRCIVVGHSLGGKIAMLLALLFNDMVEGLVVADIPPASTAGHGMKQLAKKMNQAIFPSHFLHPGLTEKQSAEKWLESLSESTKVRQLLMQNIDFSSQHPRWSIGIEEIWAGIDNLQSWPHLEMGINYNGPCLFIKGELSPYITEDHFSTMRTLFPSFDLFTLPNAGHWLQVDNNKGFIEAIRSFLLKLENTP